MLHTLRHGSADFTVLFLNLVNLGETLTQGKNSSDIDLKLNVPRSRKMSRSRPINVSVSISRKVVRSRSRSRLELEAKRLGLGPQRLVYIPALEQRFLQAGCPFCLPTNNTT